MKRDASLMKTRQEFKGGLLAGERDDEGASLSMMQIHLCQLCLYDWITSGEEFDLFSFW